MSNFCSPDKESGIESCFIQITRNQNEKLLIGSLYHPPNTCEKNFLTYFKKLNQEIKSKKYSDYIIGMDHNLDLLKHHLHAGTQSFLELMFDYNVLPCVTRPTCITTSTATLLDNLLVSMNIYTKQKTNVLLYDLSDHLPCFLLVKNYFENRKEKLFTCKRDLNEKNIKKLSDILSHINWNDHLCDQNTEDSMNTFHKIVMEKLDAISPERLVPVSTNRAIKECWMSPGLLKYSRKQLSLYKKFIATRTETSLSKYKMYKTMYKKVKRSCCKEFYLKKCVELKNHSRKLWQMINTVT